MANTKDILPLYAGPNIECSETFILEPDLAPIFQNRLVPKSAKSFNYLLFKYGCSLCSSPINSASGCTENAALQSSVDCTRWNYSHASHLLSDDTMSLSHIPEYFPNINLNANLTTCAYSIVNHIKNSYTDSMDSNYEEECTTNCTAILTNGCNISIFVLENVDSRKIENFSVDHCGTYEVKCCTDSIPSSCTNVNAISNSVAKNSIASNSNNIANNSNVSDSNSFPVAIIGGSVAGAVLLLAFITVVAVISCIGVCIVLRRRKARVMESER